MRATGGILGRCKRIMTDKIQTHQPTQQDGKGTSGNEERAEGEVLGRRGKSETDDDGKGNTYGIREQSLKRLQTEVIHNSQTERGGKKGGNRGAF